MFLVPWLVGTPQLLMLKVRRSGAWFLQRFVGQFGEKGTIVFEIAVEPSFQVYRKVKNLLLFWARRCKRCDNDQRRGLLKDWQAAIGLM